MYLPAQTVKSIPHNNNHAHDDGLREREGEGKRERGRERWGRLVPIEQGLFPLQQTTSYVCGRRDAKTGCEDAPTSNKAGNKWSAKKNRSQFFFE